MNGRNGENEPLRLFRIASNRNWIVSLFFYRKTLIPRNFYQSCNHLDKQLLSVNDKIKTRCYGKNKKIVYTVAYLEI